jgi:dephospho-CoA kinase
MVEDDKARVMSKLYFVIGASGAGKTSAVRQLEKAQLPGLKTFFFDSVGTPTPEAMIEKWGGGESWQRAMTIEWVARIKPELETSVAILDGQTRPQFISDACRMHGLVSYAIILVHCSDAVRRARLIERGQPALANRQMMEWAAYLLRETEKAGGAVIDNDEMTIPETADLLKEIVQKDVAG